ncbi:MAG: AbrB/MazE/SpoVT family DNA-binding domain-containing protein [Candidatus Electryonea clarkiae]|nr:AbrB/MazE/SpoVT family DNA-binding domain-containing protein [Candidatus Electryonea clarkiae]MDP8285779.1 AbrB/MazE/SpoVT family DNA-binding domain-containing protein [Candidatus Electryonea clarkiae]
MQTKIMKWGNSLAIRIPKVFAKEVSLDEKAEVDISISDGNLIIKPSSARYQLRDLIGKITPENIHNETEWGNSTGKEIW